ncbi:MAG: glycine zipper 2TM domain-containing protein [Sphingomonadaceae bacterium]
MKTLALFALVTSTLAAPVLAQSYEDQKRWDDAQARYQREMDVYQQERDRYYQARDRDRSGADRFGTNYDAAKDYRSGPQYSERQLDANDQVYRGSDGRYYCKRSDGTTGLIVGAAAGGLLGNVIDGGRHRMGGTLIGGALGALLGRSVDQNGTLTGGQDVRCK